MGVLECSRGENDRVVAFAQVLEGQIRAECDVAEEAHVATVEDAVKCCRDALDARMVGGDSVANEAERCG